MTLSGPNVFLCCNINFFRIMSGVNERVSVLGTTTQSMCGNSSIVALLDRTKLFLRHLSLSKVTSLV